MKKYTFSFIGRQDGAIGIDYKITDTYYCESMDEAKSCLYRDYEHIKQLKINGSTDLREYEEASFIEVPKRDHVNNPRK